MTGVSIDNIEQIGSKQMFIVSFDNYRLLYSYYTIVGVQTITWFLTTKRYSVTTRKQLTQFPYFHTKVSEEEMQAIIKSIQTQ